MTSIEDRIKAAFDEYRATTALLERFVGAREHAKELVILVCSRLDALANLAMTQNRSQRDRFVSFLHAYSGRSTELGRVLLPNMYFDIFLQFTTVAGTVPVAGRLCSYDPSRDALFLQYIVDSGVPLTSDDVTRWLHRLSVWLQHKYRTTVTQSKAKPYYDDVKSVIRHLEACSRGFRKDRYAEAVATLSPILASFRLGDLLYREYRSRSIHEFRFNTDERFFAEPGLYVATRFHAWDSTRFLEVCVSAQWLVGLYKGTLDRYERSLLARRKLPIDLWSELCDTGREFAFLDDSSVRVGRDLRVKVER